MSGMLELTCNTTSLPLPLPPSLPPSLFLLYQKHVEFLTEGRVPHTWGAKRIHVQPVGRAELKRERREGGRGGGREEYVRRCMYAGSLSPPLPPSFPPSLPTSGYLCPMLCAIKEAKAPLTKVASFKGSILLYDPKNPSK